MSNHFVFILSIPLFISKVCTPVTFLMAMPQNLPCLFLFITLHVLLQFDQVIFEVVIPPALTVRIFHQIIYTNMYSQILLHFLLLPVRRILYIEC